MNEELNKKLAEWRFGNERVEIIPPEATNTSRMWIILKPITIKTEPFTESLDACFKWLVPKLKEIHYAVILQVSGEHLPCVELIPDYGNPDVGYCNVSHRELALALCLAIEKLIDSEVTDE